MRCRRYDPGRANDWRRQCVETGREGSRQSLRRARSGRRGRKPRSSARCLAACASQPPAKAANGEAHRVPDGKGPAPAHDRRTGVCDSSAAVIGAGSTAAATAPTAQGDAPGLPLFPPDAQAVQARARLLPLPPSTSHPPLPTPGRKAPPSSPSPSPPPPPPPRSPPRLPLSRSPAAAIHPSAVSAGMCSATTSGARCDARPWGARAPGSCATSALVTAAASTPAA
eukprot:scaffold216_cov78-Isochrysis_galbana.AAC.2